MTSFENKIASRPVLDARVAQLPRPMVLTNGMFDILHRGHVTCLAQTRALGASLVAAVNTDFSVKRLGKGDDRPVNQCEDRLAALAAPEPVSLVVPLGEDTALDLVHQGCPDIYATGGDYGMTAIPEGQAVAAYGGRAVAIEFQHQRSTTALMAKIRQRRG